MKTDEIRQRFLDFFKGKEHKVIASDSLIPQNDPTLLFTGAGMNQFKDNFLGLKKDLKRATSSQKCLRTGDLEEVGRTPYHHSFFEMLGNFSFGDYFKAEAIQWAWEFLTADLRIPVDRLRVTVHKEDVEALKIWRDRIKICPNWIYSLGDQSNFWPANAPAEGPNGPCGPCSEIYFDQNPASKSEDIKGSRFTEIWNLVFTQFDRQESGKLVPLAQKNIDTGMGLERLACVLQGKKSNFEIDLFLPIHQSVLRSLSLPEKGDFAVNHLYAISDHVRAVVFSITDGALPSNEGRGYVVRKLIRRALWRAHRLLNADPSMGRPLKKPFLCEGVPAIVKVMGKTYPELADAAPHVTETIRREEERFLETLETGLRILGEKMKQIQSQGKKSLPGEIVFELYDTYGFPEELTKVLAEERGLNIDPAEFNQLMEEQRKRAKAASPIGGSIFTASDTRKKIAECPPTRFLGYDALEARGRVLFVESKDGKGMIVLDQTPFYAESGGQVGDQGILETPSFHARVSNTLKEDKQFLHYVEIEKGSVRPGDEVLARVDRKRREGTMRNHTATHLLHAALRQVLGSQVRQLGSLVNPERLRFDFSYGQALTPDQTRILEDQVNEQILRDIDVTKEEKPFEEAKAGGALAFFGEKYGEKVRVITVPGFSKEFCGGTHCSRTGQIGFFLIVNDSSIGSGVRRIEALTGKEALNYSRNLRSQMLETARLLKTTPQEITRRLTKLQETVKKYEKGQGPASGAPGSAGKQEAGDRILEQALSAGTVNFSGTRLPGFSLQEMRQLSDKLRTKGRRLVYLLSAVDDERCSYLLGMSQDLSASRLDMGRLFKELFSQWGISSGGRKDLVQGGSASAASLEENNWEAVIAKAVEYLKKGNF